MALSAPKSSFSWVAVASGLLVLVLVPGGFAQIESARATGTNGVASSNSGTNHWPGFRGPGGTGHAVQANPLVTWNVKEGKNILWKAKVPKPGLSSPVVCGNLLFLTGADDLGRHVYCYDADSGKLLWQHEAAEIPGSPSEDELPRVLDETGYAAPTMVADGRFVTAIFATGDLVCLSMEGERVWARNLGVPNNHYGHASSLIAHEGLLFVQYDQKNDSQLRAFNLASGDLVWKANRGVISWSSPILVENKGRKELILTNSKTVEGYDPATGKLLWRVECLKGEVAPSAAYANGIVCVANEYAAAWAIDIRNHDSEPKILWSWEGALPDASSPLATERFLVLPTGFGAVSCLDLKTGKVYWEHDFDAGFYSSPILVNDRVYLADVSGGIQVFRLAEQFELLGTSDMGEDVYATPAFVGGRIYVRGGIHLFCISE